MIQHRITLLGKLIESPGGGVGVHEVGSITGQAQVADRHSGLSLREGVTPDLRMFLWKIIVTTSPWLSGASPARNRTGGSLCPPTL